MSDQSPLQPSRINAICDQFENAWQAETVPKIADYLDAVEPTQRADLLGLLLAVDIEFRGKRDGHVDTSVYEPLGQEAVALAQRILENQSMPLMGSPMEKESALVKTTQPEHQKSEWIGPYKLLQKIGEGGMGVVWRAEQEEPVRRHVALKVVKSGRHTKQVLARFDAERQALALMAHPNIAQVLDAGTTDYGQPYFVMELVEGIPLTDYCDKNQLNIQKRLQLFISVCHAIQHAHQKGIIHRDLKPSNVLVTDYDGAPVPKVIDFGLAKALDQQNKLTNQTLFTEFGQVLGTLQYMSPEQAEINPINVDTRTDIYSLGIILYELLTGTTPIQKEKIKEVALLQALEVVREKVPPTPSSRLSDSGDTLSDISQQRKVEPKRLQQILSGDLDWIVMKALEKNPDRRYDGAASFAKDIQRFLNHEPVLARRPSKAYQLKKFLSRHRLAASFVFAIAVLLVVGVTLSTSLAIWALQERTLANNEARRALDLQKEAEQEAKDREQVVEFVNEALRNPSSIKDRPIADISFHDTVLAMLRRVKNKRFVENPHTEATLRKSIGIFLLEMGDYKRSRDQFEIAYQHFSQISGKLSLQAISCMSYLAECTFGTGDYVRTVELYQENLELRIAFHGSEHQGTIHTAMQLALAYSYDGQFDKALKLGEETGQQLLTRYATVDKFFIVDLCSLVKIYRVCGDQTRALETAEKLRSDLQTKRLYHRPTDRLAGCRCLAETYEAYGHVSDSLQFAQQALKLTKARYRNSHPLIIDLTHTISSLKKELGEVSETIKMLEQSALKAEQFLGPHHPFTIRAKLKLAQATAEQQAASLTDDNAVLSAGASLPPADSKIEDYQLEIATELFETHLADGLEQLGKLYNRTNQPEKAIQVLQFSLSQFRDEPSEPTSFNLPIMSELMISYRLMRDYESAIDLGKSIFAVQKEQPGLSREENLRFLREMSECCVYGQDTSQTLDFAQEALKRTVDEYGVDHERTLVALDQVRSLGFRCHQQEKSLQIHKEHLDEIVQTHGKTHPWSIFERKNYAVALQMANRLEEATKQFAQVVDLCEKSFGKIDYYTLVYIGYYQNHLLVCSQQEAARPIILQWLEAIQETTSFEKNPRIAWAKTSLADCYIQQGDFGRAKQLLEEVMALNETILPTDMALPPREMLRGRSLYGLCLAHEGKFAEAAEVAITAFEEQRATRICITSPYFQWYYQRSLECIIQIYQLAKQPEKVTYWKRQRDAFQEELAREIPGISIR